MTEKKQFQIKVFGEQYSIMSDESEQRVQEVTSLVDSLMTEINKHTASSLPPHKVAVLASLRIATMLLAQQDEERACIEQIDALSERAASFLAKRSGV